MASEPDFKDISHAVATSLRHHWQLFLIEGVILVVPGLAAVVTPAIATLAVDILFGWIFLISGVVCLISTFRTQQAPAFVWSLGSAIL